MVIVDRSFCNLYEVAYKKFHGYLAVLLFKLGTYGWDSNNDERFYSNGIESEERQFAMKAAGIEPTEEDLVEGDLSRSVIESERQ